MPCSKTYTNNKANELLEVQMDESAHLIDVHKEKSIASTIFWEVIKITSSILLTTYFNFQFIIPTLNNNNTIPYPEQIKILLYHIAGFIILYVLFTGLIKLIKWLFEILFSNRMFSSVKTQAYNLFHKRVINYLYLGVIFENKYSVYLNQKSKDKNDKNYNRDLAINYFSQSIYYYKKADIEIENIIPERVKKEGRKEKTNAKFLNSIGYSHILISFNSAKNSLTRMNESITNLYEISSSDLEFYKPIISNLQQDYIEPLIDKYQSHIIRTNELMQTLKKNS